MGEDVARVRSMMQVLTGLYLLESSMVQHSLARARTHKERDCMLEAVPMHTLQHVRIEFVLAAVHDMRHYSVDSWHKEVAEANQMWELKQRQKRHHLHELRLVLQLMLLLVDSAAKDWREPDALQTDLHCGLRA